jgi:hypothetical protein
MGSSFKSIRLSPVPALLTASIALGGSASLSAGDISTDERLRLLEVSLQRLQQKVDRQDMVIAKQQGTITRQRNQLEHKIESARQQNSSKGDSGWWQGVEMSGVIELEASASDPYEGVSSSDLVVATAEIGIAAQINDWVAGEISLLHEEDDTDLEVDVATITIANQDKTPFFFTGGQTYVPFGVYETGAVSDPLTLELGETRETVAQVGFETGGWSGSVFGFNGDVDSDGDDQVEQFGANLGYAAEFGNGASATFGVSYISSLGDSDSLQGVIITSNPGSYTGGASAFASISSGPWTLLGEYLTATEEFDSTTLAYDGDGAKPSAWNLELDYETHLFGMPTSFALAVQGTNQALGLELPETRYLLAASAEVYDNTTLSLELAHDEDYGSGDSAANTDGAVAGTGKSADTLTLQLAVGF